MKISLIAAISENKVIGRDNDLPWHIPEDLKRFKEITKGHSVIMGRKTYESIGRLLPNRVNIIITRDTAKFLNSHPEFISGSDEMLNQVQHDETKGIVVSSIDEAINVASSKYQVSSIKDKNESHDTKYLIHNTDQNEVFIIGGGQIFDQSIAIADKLYLTIIHTTIDGDAYFPDYSAFKKEVYRRDSANEKYSYTFLDLEK